MTERILALKLAGDLAIAYPGRTVSEDHASSWARELEAVSLAEAQAAVALLRLRSTDPPAVAQLREVLREVQKSTMSEWTTWKCVFLDNTECPQCHLVHGRLMMHNEAVLAGIIESIGTPA